MEDEAFSWKDPKDTMIMELCEALRWEREFSRESYVRMDTEINRLRREIAALAPAPQK